MSFTIKQLEVFAAVANSQSITAAAKQLHLIPPAISKQIANLAANTNLELFTTVGKRFPMQLVYREKQVMSELFIKFKDYVVAYWNQDF